jgi:hypothetical protein
MVKHLRCLTNWLLLVETANGVDMPWTTLQQARPKAVVRLADD